MKMIVRRLRRLEDRFCPPVETEFSWRLQEKIEAGLRRVAEARERGELDARGGAFLLLGVYFTWRNLRLAQEGQITQRFTMRSSIWALTRPK